MNQFSPSVFIFLLKVDSGYLLLLVDCALMPQSQILWTFSRPRSKNLSNDRLTENTLYVNLNLVE